MKTLGVTFYLLVIMTVVACAMGSKPPAYERKPQDKLWRACEPQETAPESNIGKMCNRSCLERKGNKCKEWKQNVKDFSKPEDFEFFRSSSFVFIDEDNL